MISMSEKGCIFELLNLIVGIGAPLNQGFFICPLRYCEITPPGIDRNSLCSPDEGLSTGKGGLTHFYPPVLTLKNSSI